MADIKILNNDIVSFQGTVGIGTESPGRILDISKTDQSNEFIGIRFTNDSGNGEIGTLSGYTRLYSGGIITYAANSTVSYFYVNSNLAAALDGNGLAIGNTSSTEKLDVYGNARITSRIYSHKATSGTVVSGEWYRVIELTGGSGRGKCDFIIESAGGSGTPFVLKATVNTAWANDESSIFCHFNSRGSGVGELRVVRNSTSNKSFIDVKFSGGEDAVNVYILPTVNFAADVLPWGNVTTLPAGDAVESSINVTNKVMAHASHRLTETYTDQFVLSYNNKLGIGKDPNYKLDVSDNIYTGIGMYSTYDYSGNRNWAWRLNTFGSGNWGGIGLWQSAAADGNPSSGSIRFGIDQSGNVGINVTAPSEKLEVLGNIRLNTIGNELQFNNHNVGAYRDGNNRLVLGGYGGIQFNAEGVGGMENQSVRMIITDAGEVGIGTIEPATQLEIQNSETGNGIGGSTIRLTRNDSTVVAEDPIGGIEFYNKDADGAHISSFIKGVAREQYGRLGALSFGTATTNSTNATETMRLSETGNLNVSREGNKNGGTILIGPNENGSHWSFLAGSHYAQGTGAGNGSGSAGVALIGSYSDSANNRVYIGGGPYEINPATTIFFNTHDATTHTLGGTTRMIIDDLGNVAIGKPSASYKLDVEGTINMTGLFVNGHDQISGARFFEPLAYVDAYTRTTTANSTDEWVKVISVAAGPRRIRLALYHGGDNTNAYDEYLISHSSYNMQTHIFRLPGSKYNTSKILGVKAICPSGSTQEVWVKVSGVTSSNGTFQYRSNVEVLPNATVSASAQASEPSNTTGSSVITFDSNDRNAYTTISSGGAKLSGHLQGTSASFTDPVTIYDTSTSENPRLSIGRGTDQRLKFSVDDNAAIITHEQDEQVEGYPHSMMFTIDSPAPTSKTFYWQHRLQNGSGSYTNMYLNSTGLTITDDLYVGGGIIELDDTATTIPAGSMTHYTNGYLYLKGGTGGAAIGNSTFGAAFYAPADNTLQFVAGASEKMRIDTNGQVGIGVTSPDGMLHVLNNNGTKMRHGLYGSIGQRYSAWDTWIGNNTSVATDQTSAIELLTNYLGSGASATKFGFQDFGFYQWAPDDLTGLSAGSQLTLPAPSLYISTAKNVGIGTASPAVSLHVNGWARFNGGLQLDGNNRKIYAIDNTNLLLGTNNTERMRITNTGLVGIGKTSPSEMLDVAGTIKAESLSVTSGGSGGEFLQKFVWTHSNSSNDGTTWRKVCDVNIPTGLFAALSMDIVYYYPSSNYGNSAELKKWFYSASFRRSHNVQDSLNDAILHGPDPDRLRIVKTATGVYELQARINTINQRCIVEYSLTSNGSSWVTPTNNIVSGSTTGTIYTATEDDDMFISTGGRIYSRSGIFNDRVGIGTDSPGAKLDVNGVIVSRGGSYTSGVDTNGSVGLVIQEGHYIFTEDGGDYLRRLIGKSTGDIIEIGQSGTSLIDGVNFFSGVSCNYRWHNNGSVAMLLNSTGLQIGNTNTTYALDVTGTIRASSDIIAFSDARVKENVKTIDNALDKVTQLRGVSYNKIGETEEKIGVIAQEIEKVLPQVVQEDDEGMKSVAYGNIVGVLIEAIKEQQKQIDELKARLDGSTK